MPRETTPPTRSVATAAFAVALVAVVAQLPWALPGAFLWDDLPLLVARDLYVAPERWSESLCVPLGVETWYWRPLATTSFLLESLIHGGSATGFRVTAALLHALAAGCATLLFGRLYRSRTAALVAGLIWAVHPASVEAVTWISGRFDLLSALFMLIALLFVRIEGGTFPRWRRVVLGFVAALALLSKENAIALPLLVALWGLALAPAESGVAALIRQRWRTWTATCAGLIAVLLIRAERLGFVFGVNPRSADEAGGALEHVLLVGRAFATYVEVLVVPWAGVGPAHHGSRPIPVTDPEGWVGLLLLAAFVAWTLRAWWRRDRIAPLLTAFLVGLAPVLQIIPLDLSGGLHAADRYLYLPSFFAVAAAVEVARRHVVATGSWPARRRQILAGAAIVVLSLGVGRALVLRNWTSPTRFWAWAVAEAPESSVTLSNRVHALLGSGWMTPAEREDAYETALRLHRLDPEFRQAHLVIEVLIAEGRAGEAVRIANQALQFQSRDAGYHLLRGRAHLALGEAKRALTDFRRASQLARSTDGRRFLSLLPDAWAGSAEALIVARIDRAEAEVLAEQAESLLDRAEPSGVAQVARARLVLVDPDGVLRAIGDGARIPPFRLPELLTLGALTEMPPRVLDVLLARSERAGVPEAAVQAALALGHETAGRWETAAEHYQRVVDLAPDSARDWDNLGYALFETGDVEGCERALRQSVVADAEYPQARLHLGVLLRKTGREDAGLQELRTGVRLAREAGDDEMVELLERQLALPPAGPVEDPPDDGR